jgi:hypothetical protein
MTAYTKFLYPPKTHYLKAATCERQQLASPEDMDIPHCVDNADEAIAVIRDHYAQWQSQRISPASV